MFLGAVFFILANVGLAELAVDDSYSNELHEYVAAVTTGATIAAAVSAPPVAALIVAYGAGIGEQYLEESIGY